MPELPEVQAHAERLDAALRGVELSAFEPLSFTALKTFEPRPESVVGRPLASVARRGKHLLLAFADESHPVTFVVHLMQGGRLRVDTGKARKPRGGLARWRFEDATTPGLLLTEAGTEHKAGIWLLAGDPLVVPPLDHLGPEADTLDAGAVTVLFREHSMRLHGFLRDQRILAGLGRRLANEVCWRARLSPFAQTRSLDQDAAVAVAAGIRTAVDEGLAAERAGRTCRRPRTARARCTGAAGSRAHGVATASARWSTAATPSPTAPPARPAGRSWRTTRPASS